MSKYFGKIGYITTEEDPNAPSVYIPIVTERPYYGDVLHNSRGLQAVDKVNDDVTVNVRLSIVADEYAYNNFHTMRYAEYLGTNWKIREASPAFPRILLTLGGEYHGNT